MSRGYHVSKRTALRLQQSRDQGICTSCLNALQRRQASTAIATELSPESVRPSRHPPLIISNTVPQHVYSIKAGIVLSRPPVITRDLTSFEKAFYFYQRRLNERLALPFTRYFYYQKDTPADIDWKRKIKERLTPARDIGVYNAYSKEGWNDELLVGAKESEPQEQVEALLKDAIVEEGDDGLGSSTRTEAVEKPMPRVTDADRQGDLRSLNRALMRTLYLVVQDQNGAWRFPYGGLIGKEGLRRAAERILVQTGGSNMNTWIVGNVPVGHHSVKYPQAKVDEEKKIEHLGEKTFFLKGRIMAGQANLKDNSLGVADFKWLAKQEIQKEVLPHYWNSVKNMLVDR